MEHFSGDYRTLRSSVPDFLFVLKTANDIMTMWRGESNVTQTYVIRVMNKLQKIILLKPLASPNTSDL